MVVAFSNFPGQEPGIVWKGRQIVRLWGDLTRKILYNQPNETIDKLRTPILPLKPKDVQINKNESKKRSQSGAEELRLR